MRIKVFGQLACGCVCFLFFGLLNGNQGAMEHAGSAGSLRVLAHCACCSLRVLLTARVRVLLTGDKR
jgi:hypothetical protein